MEATAIASARAGGAIWMIAVSAAFAAQALTMIGTRAAFVSLAIGLAIAIALLIASIVLLVRARRERRAIEPVTPERRVAMRRFWWVVAAEMVLIAGVNAASMAAGRPTLIVPLDLLIVGVHFLPLAWIFGVPRYYLTGLAFCAVAILTLVVFPDGARIGHGASRHVVASLGCTTVAWLTAMGNLNEAFRLLSGDRAS